MVMKSHGIWNLDSRPGKVMEFREMSSFNSLINRQTFETVYKASKSLAKRILIVFTHSQFWRSWNCDQSWESCEILCPCFCVNPDPLWHWFMWCNFDIIYMIIMWDWLKMLQVDDIIFCKSSLQCLREAKRSIEGLRASRPQMTFPSDFPSCSESAEIWHVNSFCVKKCPCFFFFPQAGKQGLKHILESSPPPHLLAPPPPPPISLKIA